MSEDNIKKSRDIEGKNTLLVCIDYFNIFVIIPTSGASSNIRERNQQEIITKRIKLHEVISDGGKQYRK